MTREGPPLDALTRRLAECPPALLEAPLAGERGAARPLRVDAVVFDLVHDLGGPAPAPDALARFCAGDRDERRLVLVAAWLAHDPWLRAQGRFGAAALAWLSGDLADLARLVPAAHFVHDPERREELARRALDALGLRPRGETPAQAADRLRTLDSVARERVVAELRAREKRARELREAMRRKAAEEAAARWSPE